MSLLAIGLLFFLLPQQPFDRFSYCRENTRGVFENQCAQLDADGSGEVRLRRRKAEEVKIPIALSAPGKDRFIAVLAGTGFLANGETYESKRKVADLGMKHLVLDMPNGRREAQFNYSELKEVTALVSFFEAVLNQEALVFDIDTAIQFERLSIPKRLDQLENELKANRIADPLRLMPLLERIEKDAKIVNYARTHARKLKEGIEKGGK